MDSTLLEILDEWEEGMFMFPELLAEAYTTLLGHLIGATAAERRDPRVMPFLLAGYTAYVEDQKGQDSHAALTYRMALAMVGCGSNVPPTSSASPVRPATPPARPTPSPEQGPSRAPSPPPSPSRLRSPSPQTGPSKRPREEDSQGEEEEGPTLEVLQSRERKLKRFDGVTFREEVIAIRGLGDSLPDEPTMVSLFDTVIQRQKKAVGAKDTDKVVLELQGSENGENPIWLSMRNADQLDGRVVLDRLTRVLNSNETFIVGGQLRVSYVHIQTPRPGGRRTDRVPNESTDQWLQRKMDTKTIWSPSNANDHMCLTRSVAIAIAHGRMKRQALYKMKQPGSRIQETEAKRLCDLAQIPQDRPAGLDEVRKLQDVLPDYRLCVFKNQKAECEYKGTHTATRKNIYLLLHNGHFSAILFPCQAFQQRFECKRCVTFYNNEGSHRYCKKNVDENHLCYIQKWSEKEKKRGIRYINIYFDLETEQSTPVEGKPGTFEHKPVLLVSQAVCDLCSHVEQNEHFCPVCKTRQQNFHNMDDGNVDVISQFINYLQSFGPKAELLIMAHNGKSFDFVFFIHEIVSRQLKFDTVLQGAKIISMTVGRTWKFIDSLSFLPMPLSAMPKSFGLNELKKGWFPFLAVKKDYFNYSGHMLPKTFYCVTSMKNKAAKEFHAWYDEQVSMDKVFDFRQDLLAYCISDVTILRQSCRAFRQLFEQTAGFDPIFNCITLSSACMCAYRRNFLKPNTIGLVPPGGYHGRGRQSHIALQWLDYESHKLGRVIQTIYSHREVSVLGRRVDGYIELPRPDGQVEKRIYQFHGDYWHQCPQHFPVTEDTSENRFEQTWECSFKHDLEHNPEVKAYFQAHPTTRVEPLRLRDALTGGRTSAMQWFCEPDLTKGEKIKMVDVVSEYPGVNLRGRYPLGHPDIFLQGNPDMPPVDKGNGVIKCTVLPPRDLFVPLLRYRASGRLMFPLCRMCVETLNEDRCNHDNPKDRQLTDTWCAPELVMAIQEKGYTPTVKNKIVVRNELRCPVSSFEKLTTERRVRRHRTSFSVGIGHKYGSSVPHFLSTVMPYLAVRNGDSKISSTVRAVVGRHHSTVDTVKGINVLIEVHEVYQYPSTVQFDPETDTEGLFSGYIRCFMALKVQASGWPAECITPEQKQAFMDDLKKYDGIIIDQNKVEKNGPIRQLSKLLLNSFGGKFGEKTIRPKTVFVYDYGDLMNLVSDPTKEVTALRRLSLSDMDPRRGHRRITPHIVSSPRCVHDVLRQASTVQVQSNALISDLCPNFGQFAEKCLFQPISVTF
ncbi:putative DNA polymerase [Frankliniella fusca]|uniref:DNA-directed DNA polymerase n=1 Tax=Frankliniella fusca TaxID=407009 RepID=A0AAE1GZ72_9NEOP|nr:putative DNA polymerase [Frankliniella fusca]